MATKLIVDMRRKNCYGYEEDSCITKAETEHLINLVEEYGDALLRIAGGGSEMFRNNGTEVDPKACEEKFRQRLDSLHRVIHERIKK